MAGVQEGTSGRHRQQGAAERAPAGTSLLHAPAPVPSPHTARPEKQRGGINTCSLWTRSARDGRSRYFVILTYFFLFLYTSDQNSLKSTLL